MRIMGAISTLAALLFGIQAQAQTLTYSISPETIKGYAKVSLNTTFQLNLEENEGGMISTAEVDPGLGISAAAGLALLPEVDGELEISSYTGDVDYRSVAGVPVLSIPADEVQLLSVFANAYYKFRPATNARFKMGGGLGYGQYTLKDSTGLKHRGSGIVYQVKGVGEYDFGSNITFLAEAGYIGTTDIDVDIIASNTVRDTALTGITFGLGAKVKF